MQFLALTVFLRYCASKNFECNRTQITIESLDQSNLLLNVYNKSCGGYSSSDHLSKASTQLVNIKFHNFSLEIVDQRTKFAVIDDPYCLG